jgi:hypothetical protein
MPRVRDADTYFLILLAAAGNAASVATFGGLLVGGLVLRLTGAKAREADHPSD